MVKGQRRYRYIRFQIKPLEKSPLPSEAEFLQELRRQARVLTHQELRDLGCWLVRYQATSGVIKCHYLVTETIKTLLSSLHSVGTCTVAVIPERTSGTIHGATYKA